MNAEGRLHLFGGFENKKLGITSDMELGHLYDWRNEVWVLEQLGKEVGMKPNWMQCDTKTGFWHFDLWGKPLDKAKELFRIVSDIEFADDVTKISAMTKRD